MPGLPPFTSGAVGFFAYDIVRQIEHLPTLAADELHVPDAHLMFFDEVLAFDHVRKAIHLIVTAGARTPLRTLTASSMPTTTPTPASTASKPSSKPRCTSPRAPTSQSPSISPHAPPAKTSSAPSKPPRSTSAPATSSSAFSRNASTAPPASTLSRSTARCASSTRRPTCTSCASTPRRGAQQREAAPHAHIVGSSPELLVRVHGRNVEYRPIAGTRPRGADESHDRTLEADLRADAKEVAEHVMLVDLGRNDLGRVSDFGTVRVKDLMFIERYSHVMHLVSALEGTLKPALAPIDALRACFPAGTLSGAPKIRAMEIIEELEPARRGVYGGAIIYADFSGNLDSCIAIRTLFMDGERGHIQAGAGIVADSIPEREDEECRNKAAAVVRAIERARSA